MKSIQPIWMRTERFFLYPLQPAIAISASLLACTPLWLSTVKEPVAVWVLAAGLCVLTATLLFNVLEHGMRGLFTSPNFSKNFQSDYLPVACVQTALLAAVVAVLYFSQRHLGDVFAFGLGTLITFCLPATLMIFGACRQITEALNPIKITEFILQLGRTYFVLIAFIYLIEGGLVVCFEQMLVHFPWIVAVHWTTFLSMFLSLAVFHMMGYVVYINHEKLKHSGVDFEQDLVETEHPLTKDIKALIKTNQYDKAQELIEMAIANEPYNVDFHDTYHKLCLLRQDAKRLKEHGDQYLNFLLTKQLDDKAIVVFCDLIQVFPNYRCQTMEDTIKLAKLLESQQKYALAVQFLDGIHHHFPGHPLVPKAYGFLAKTLYERFGKDKQAKQILEFVLIEFSTSPLKHAIKAQLDKIIKANTKIS